MRKTVGLVAWLVAGGLVTARAEVPSGGETFRFRDVGKEAGLLPAASKILGHGAAWGDVDGDDRPDLYVGTFHYPDGKPNLLFRNKEGRFTLDRQAAPRLSARSTGALFADLDNDGDLDLYLASMPVPAGSKRARKLGRALVGCSLLRNDGRGGFTDVSAGNGACPPEFGGRSATVLDADGDGLLDLLVGEDPLPGYNGSPTRTSRLFRNLGNLRFETAQVGIPADAAGLGVAAADLNADGRPDLFLASTLGNRLLLNDGGARFYEPEGARATFAWPTAKGDDMVCGVAIADVNGDGLPDVALGQHYGAPWVKPVPNRLYLHRGVRNGIPQFEDVTEAAGLLPLPLKAPHVEIQDFDNDGRPDVLGSLVTFAEGKPHPLVFRNLGNRADGTPEFEQHALGRNDFPTEADRAIRRSGAFFEKMVAERKVTYAAPGPSCDFDRDGRLDLVLPSWWPELPTLLLRNETPGGNWLQVRVEPTDGVNAMGIGTRIDLYETGHAGDPRRLLGSREIATGFGYASSHQAVAHFGLGKRETCDVVLTLPWGKGRRVHKAVRANRRIRL